MIDADRSLAGYVERVLLARDVTPEYAHKIRAANRRFCDWLGCDPGIDGLECQAVNEFLVSLQQSGLRPASVSGYRRNILVVWNTAYRDGDNNNPPVRVRRIRCPRDVIEAFSHDQLNALLGYVGSLAGYFPNGIKRSDFWTAAIHAAYSTGLRRGDLLRVSRHQLGPDGIARVLQSKTRYVVAVRFDGPALAAINRMATIGDERALPWPYHPNALSRQFRRLVQAAGLRGSFCWLRRSAGSYAERDGQGNGSRLLGHRSERVFRDHYRDETIVTPQPIQPPPL